MKDRITNALKKDKKIPIDDYYIPDGIAIEYQVNHPDKVIHSHSFIEIFYILSGKIEHNFNGNKKTLVAGDFALIDLNSYHSLTRIKGESCDLINCLFRPSFLDISLSNNDDITKIYKSREIQYRGTIPKETYINSVYHENDDKIKKLLIDMQSEYFRSEFGYLKVMKAQLIELLIYILRYINPQTQDITNSVMDVAINHIEKNFYKKITLEEISSLLHYTPQYFCSKFKQETGYSFAEYLQKIRINKSCQLLQDTNMKVSEIAEAVGYSDIRYYEKIFRKYINRTPLQHRKFERANMISPPSKKHGHKYFDPNSINHLTDDI